MHRTSSTTQPARVTTPARSEGILNVAAASISAFASGLPLVAAGGSGARAAAILDVVLQAGAVGLLALGNERSRRGRR